MSTVARLSITEYDRIIESGAFDGPNKRRIELIDGELREMTPIGPTHEETVDVLTEWSVDHTPRSEVRVRVQNSVGLPQLDSVPEPDIAWVSRRNYGKGRPSAKDVFLLIEVADSSLVYDLSEKAELYAKVKINDYWVIDLVNFQVEVLRDPYRGRYRSRQTIHAGGKIRPLAFPRLAFPVNVLFNWS